MMFNKLPVLSNGRTVSHEFALLINFDVPLLRTALLLYVQSEMLQEFKYFEVQVSSAELAGIVQS